MTDDQVNDDYNFMSRKINLSGTKSFDEIQSYGRDSFYKLNINGSCKYIRHHSACWLLTNKKIRFSNDRLSGVVA